MQGRRGPGDPGNPHPGPLPPGGAPWLPFQWGGQMDRSQGWASVTMGRERLGASVLLVTEEE